MFNFKKNSIGKIKKISEDFLKKITPEAEIEVSVADDETVTVDAKVADPQTLIGQDAETLQAMQHLLRVILRKSVDGIGRVELDVNGYRKKRKEYLKELAVAAANDVALSKKEISLPAMGAYERRLVHMELAARIDIATESRGDEPNRRIVIKPA
jgi:spoIIIJ-associated protein